MMVFEDIAAWRRERASRSSEVGGQRSGIGERQETGTLGFVPTMGALHRGHVSLVERSVRENSATLVSIFVNATQFNESADLANYPRTLEQDLALLERAGVDYVLLPRHEQLYADGYRFRVVETECAATLEGKHRPGHFDGVLTVVLKLLQLAAADRAYFGEKDWQQLHLIRGMTDAFFLPTSIVGCPTVRESSGLAMSSRNARLEASDIDRAAILYRALSQSSSAAAARQMLEAEGFDVDYVEDHDARRLAAVRLGGVRLIDNISLSSLP